MQVYTKEFRRGFGNREKDKNKGVCTKQNRSVVRGSNVIMSDFYLLKTIKIPREGKN